MTAQRLVCLLPARNCAEHLAGYFESVARFADAVVALDDGSTDETCELLMSSALVARVLTNARRDRYSGWDDATNRARLLVASRELEPDWIISLDADERIAPDDAAALRGFVEEEARAGCAYSFRCYRMVGGLDSYDPDWLSVGRLFAYDRSYTFPASRLHLVPIPVQIPRSRRVQTTLRIQHLAARTPAERAARFTKYREADPECRWQRDYSHLLAPPRTVRKWEARPADLRVIARPRRFGRRHAVVALKRRLAL